MSILGIENRTENWKTAEYFAPFFTDQTARLRLADRLGASKSTPLSEVKIELFWKGMRDHLHQCQEKPRNNQRFFPTFSELYVTLFPDLRERISKFDPSGNKLRLPKQLNYEPEKAVDVLGNNLVNTEIDVVLETPTHLLIGEAKHKARLGTDGDDVLVHQLIRQYVMAWMLVVLRDQNRKVVPFVVGGNAEQSQVKFMIGQKWMPEENVISWKDIKRISGDS